MKTRTRLSLLAALLLILSAPMHASAQTNVAIGPRGGYGVDNISAPFVGGDLRVGLAALPVRLNATYDTYLGEGDDLYQFTANALYDFEVGNRNRTFTPYAGAGLSVAGFETGDESITDLGMNLLFGAEFETGTPFRPFAQAQFTLFGDADIYAVGGGLLFEI